jgi:ParB-like chromosome segregation protein Spo0J
VILAGHGRIAAAKLIGLREVPVICLDDLSEAQVEAYSIADNRLTDRSDWDETRLAVQLKVLSGGIESAADAGLAAETKAPSQATFSQPFRPA